MRDFKQTQVDELYDLAQDSGETTSLIGEPGLWDTLSQLDERMAQRMAEIDDPALAG